MVALLGRAAPDASLSSAARLGRRLSPEENVYIARVLHRSFVETDEKGTEAVAATEFEMETLGIPSRPEPPVILRLDRPFMIAIERAGLGIMLFAGAVEDPSAG